MCGIFAFISRYGEGPNLGLLKRIAVVTERRGRHAFGLAWIDRDGQLQTFKRPGAASDNLLDIDRVEGAKMVIGHCRFATHGDPQDNRNNHPHSAGTGYIMHNGVVHNDRELVAKYGLTPETECDSEVIGLLIAQGRGDVLARTTRAASLCEGNLAVLGLWADPARIVIVRRGNPLCFGEGKSGWYFGSLADGLPGSTGTCKPDTVQVFQYNVDGLLRGQTQELKAELDFKLQWNER